MNELNIEYIYHLVFNGRIDEMKKEIEGLNGFDKIQGELFKTYFLLEFNEATIEDYNQLIANVLEEYPNNLPIQLIARLHKLGSYWWTAEFSEGIKEISEIRRNFQRLDSQMREELRFYEIWFYHLSGTFCHSTGKYEKGFKEFFAGLALIDSDPIPPNTLFRGGINLHVGNGYMKTGDYEKAAKYYQTALDYSMEISNNMNEEMAKFNLAIVEFLRGNLSKSLELHEQCLLRNQTIGYHRGIAENLNRIGLVYYYLNEDSKAIRYLEEAFNEMKETGLVLAIAGITTNLITVYSALGHLKKAENYFNVIKKLSSNSDDHWLHSMLLISEVRILKQKKRFKDQVKAQDSLRAIIDNMNFPLSYQISAILLLIELLLQELKAFGNPDVFQEVERLSNRAYTISQEKNLIPVEIETTLLRAKLLMIKGNLVSAEKTLKEVYRIADKNNLNLLKSRIKSEQEIITSDLSKWMDLIEQNASLKERIEQSEIESYLKEAIRIQSLHSERIGP